MANSVLVHIVTITGDHQVFDVPAQCAGGPLAARLRGQLCYARQHGRWYSYLRGEEQVAPEDQCQILDRLAVDADERALGLLSQGFCAGV